MSVLRLVLPLAGIIADINFEYVFVANLAAYMLFFIVVMTTFKRFDSNALAPKKTMAESTRQARSSVSIVVTYFKYLISILLVVLFAVGSDNFITYARTGY